MSDQPKSSRTRKAAKPATKTEILLKLIKSPRSATPAELQKATGWQAHSVQGAISGTLRKNLGLTVISDQTEMRGRFYCISQSVESSAGE